uniref:NADH dehydrogenase subunit 4L n=1 Tax=Physaloptera clausa TaxID=3051302 RepID=UPI0030030C8C|nr:NADH dehydrogenase subunit 4L [Physaloptera clausa]
MFYMVSLLIFCFKFNKLIFLLLGVEIVVLGLVLEYVFLLSMFSFFYFLCFCVISSVIGLFLYGMMINVVGLDKYLFCYNNVELSLILVFDGL